MAKPRRYEIRLFDRTLVEFSLESNGLSSQVTPENYDAEATALMPCGLAPTPEGIWRWLEIRSIPTNRCNAARICRELGFSLGNLEALYRTSLGLSLNDSYWVVPRDFKGRFDDYSLYSNPFSEAIGALAVAGEVRGGPPRPCTHLRQRAFPLSKCQRRRYIAIAMPRRSQRQDECFRLVIP